MYKYKCPMCNTGVSEESVYCSKCGADMQTGSNAFFCVHCGQPLEDGAKLCAYCREPVPIITANKSEEYTALVERAINGDAAAFQEIYEKRFNDLYYIALSMLRNQHDAEDVTQTTFMQAWKSIGSLQSPYAFRGWLTRILSNNCMDLLRKKKPVPVNDDADSLFLFEDSLYEENIEFLPADVLEKKETQRLVREIIDALPDAHRQTIILHYFDLLPILEIAAIMDVSEGTVKSRLYYARLAIKEGVEAHEKQGVKLYGVTGIPLLFLILRDGALQTALAPEVIAGFWNTASAGMGIGAPVVASTVTTATTATTTGIIGKIAAVSVAAKIVAGVAACVLITGVVTAGHILSQQSEPLPEYAVRESVYYGQPGQNEDEVSNPETVVPELIAQEAAELTDSLSKDEYPEDEYPEDDAFNDGVFDDLIEDRIEMEPIISPDTPSADTMKEDTSPAEDVSSEVANPEDNSVDEANPEDSGPVIVEPEYTNQPAQYNEVILTGAGSLVFTNTSSERILIHNRSPRSPCEYVIYDENGNMTRFATYLSDRYHSYKGLWSYHLEPGSKLVISLANPSDSMLLRYDESLSDDDVRVDRIQVNPLHRVILTGSDTLTIENISPWSIRIGNVSPDITSSYTIYDVNGKATRTKEDRITEHVFTIDSGGKLSLSLSDPTDTIVIIFGSELLGSSLIVSS